MDKECPFCGVVYKLPVAYASELSGAVANVEVSSIECSCGATWAIQRPRAVKADARGD